MFKKVLLVLVGRCVRGGRPGAECVRHGVIQCAPRHAAVRHATGKRAVPARGLLGLESLRLTSGVLPAPSSCGHQQSPGEQAALVFNNVLGT
jgi:hypothetical protein